MNNKDYKTDILFDSDYYASLCQQVCEETNIKTWQINICDTEKGLYAILWNGKEVRNTLNGIDTGQTSKRAVCTLLAKFFFK